MSMTPEQAIAKARVWTRQRMEVRTHLIEAARKAHPLPQGGFADVTAYDRAVRKLWRYPADLSELRLLVLIDNPSDSEGT